MNVLIVHMAQMWHLLRRHLPFRDHILKISLWGNQIISSASSLTIFQALPHICKASFPFLKTKQYCVCGQEGQGHLAWDGCCSLKHFPVKHFNTEKFYMQYFVGFFFDSGIIRKSV